MDDSHQLKEIIMGRPPRLEFEGALYHITTRGNNQRAIFHRARDRFRFLDFLFEVAQKQHWLLYAYCLMRNHYHLLIETTLANLSQGMQRINGHYARYFNHFMDRKGHAFEKRYHSVIVEKDSHLLELSRYIVLNPVRAGICEQAEDYRWSSYRAMMGKSVIQPSLKTEYLLNQFHHDKVAARQMYAQFVAEGIQQRPWTALKQGRFLGSDSFVEEMMEKEREGEESAAKTQRMPILY